MRASGPRDVRAAHQDDLPLPGDSGDVAHLSARYSVCPNRHHFMNGKISVWTHMYRPGHHHRHSVRRGHDGHGADLRSQPQSGLPPRPGEIRSIKVGSSGVPPIVPKLCYSSPIQPNVSFRFSAESKGTRDPISFATFGHGPRSCIGVRVAELETRMTLAVLLHHYRFRAGKNSPVNIRALTTNSLCLSPISSSS